MWPPGSRCAYHAMTYGHLAGATLRRVDGRMPGRFIAEEISAPLGASFFLGLPEDQDHRAAEIVPGRDVDATMEAAAENPLAFGYVNPRVRPTTPNPRAWRAAEVPSGSGHADALSLARIYGALARGGEIEGVRLLGREALTAATAERFCGEEAGFGWPIRFGAGFMLNRDGVFGPSDRAFGHSGWGGFFAFADPDQKLGVAFVMNRMATFGEARDPRRTRLLRALYRHAPRSIVR